MSFERAIKVRLVYRYRFQKKTMVDTEKLSTSTTRRKQRAKHRIARNITKPIPKELFYYLFQQEIHSIVHNSFIIIDHR